MPKVRWLKGEADGLLLWLSRHQHLSWKEKSEAYSKDCGIQRSAEALRGKQNQMEHEARRRQVGALKANQEVARRSQSRRKKAFSLPELYSPSHNLRVPGSRAPRLLQRLRCRNHSSAVSFSRANSQKSFGRLNLLYHTAAVISTDTKDSSGCITLSIFRSRCPRVIACFWNLIHRRVAAGHWMVFGTWEWMINIAQLGIFTMKSILLAYLWAAGASTVDKSNHYMDILQSSSGSYSLGLFRTIRGPVVQSPFLSWWSMGLGVTR